MKLQISAMKRGLVTIVLTLLAVVGLFAQKTVSYQAVVRNSVTNELMVNTPMTLFVEVSDTMNHQIVYTETNHVTSNANGLVSTAIGNGENSTGEWSSIPWNHASVKITLSETASNEGSCQRAVSTFSLSVGTT